MYLSWVSRLVSQGVEGVQVVEVIQVTCLPLRAHLDTLDDLAYLCLHGAVGVSFARRTISRTSASSCGASKTMPFLIVQRTPPRRTVRPFSTVSMPVPYRTLRLCSGFPSTIARSASNPWRMTPVFGSPSAFAPFDVACRMTSRG